VHHGGEVLRGEGPMTEQSEALRLAEWRTILQISAERRAARERRQRERELDEQFAYEQSRSKCRECGMPAAPGHKHCGDCEDVGPMSERDRYCEERGIIAPDF